MKRRVELLRARGDLLQFVAAGIERPEENLRVVEDPPDIRNDAADISVRQMGGGTTKCQGHSQFSKDALQLNGVGCDLDATSFPGRQRGSSGIEGFLNDTGGGEQRTGNDLPSFEGIEIEPFIELRGAGLGLRPSLVLAKLLLNDGAGAVFHGTAYNSAVSPKPGRECEPCVHEMIT